MKLIDWLFRRRKVEKAVSCLGCVYLYLWNDGSAYCTKGYEKICIDNEFKFKKGAAKDEQNERHVKRT